MHNKYFARHTLLSILFKKIRVKLLAYTKEQLTNKKQHLFRNDNSYKRKPLRVFILKGRGSQLEKPKIPHKKNNVEHYIFLQYIIEEQQVVCQGYL